MKPVSFTSDTKAMVGMPWGVRRIDLVDGESICPFCFSHNSPAVPNHEERR